MAGCWLFKSEPGEFGIDDLAAAKHSTTRWDGIRSYQARNFIRDDIARGDRVFFYHSSCNRTGIAGICEVVSAPYPDPTQFDPASDYFDSKATPDSPRWYAVDIRLVEKLPAVVETGLLRRQRSLKQMALFRNPRLSIQPVTAKEWQLITEMVAAR